MKCCKLKSVGLSNGRVCLTEWSDKEGEPSSCQALAGCTELAYVRLRTLEAVASFRFLERAFAVMAHYDMLVFAMSSSAGSFSVVTGAEASALQKVCEELAVFAEVTMEKEVEVICVQQAEEAYGGMSEKSLVTLLKDIPLLMVSSEEGTGCVSLVVRRKDRGRVLDLFFAC